MGFKCGIVGLPNVGKSTLFNALTQAGIAAANFPFCTIEPNVGIVPMPDRRLDALAEIVRPERVVPTTMEFVDIAGLVAGASKGEGLGNQFLSHIRETDAIAHIVRCFEDENIVHVDGKIDPLHDIGVINTELALADLSSIEKAILRVNKIAKSGDKQAKAEIEILERAQKHLDQNQPLRLMKLEPHEHELLNQFNFITAKPVLYVANVAENGFHNNPHLDKVTQLAKEENAEMVTICASIESEIIELAEEEKKEFLQSMDLEEPGLNRLIRAGYHLLNLQTYFTAGVKEVRAWTIEKGMNAQQAAGKIHTDFARGFIRAEVISYEDFIQYQGEQAAKEAGKLRSEGKTYIVQDGDVMHFLFNV